MTWNLQNPRRMGQWASNLVDAIVPGKLERFLPLPRYHPWLFGIGMLGWGMNRQAALMRGSSTEVLGTTLPTFTSLSSDGGMFGSGSAKGSLMFIAVVVSASALSTLVQEAN